MFIIVWNCDKTYLQFRFGYGEATHNSLGTEAPTSTWNSVASITCWFERSQWGCVFFCNISHQQVLTRTPPLCNSCGHVLGSLGICFVQIKTQTQNRFCTKEQDAVSQSDDPFFFSRKLLQGGFNVLMFMTLVIA